MGDLFDTSASARDDKVPDSAPRPLADRLRPRALSEVIGQDKVIGPDGPLGVMLASGSLSSLVFCRIWRTGRSCWWGPPRKTRVSS